MTCEHLKELFQLCEKYELKMSASEVIRITCPQCGKQETCPSVLITEIEPKEAATETGSDASAEVDNV